MKKPILLNGHTMTPKAVLEPAAMSVSMKADGLSTASVTLHSMDDGCVVGDWVQVFAPNGEWFVGYIKSITEDCVLGFPQLTIEHTFGLLDSMVVFGTLNPPELGGGAGATTVAIGTAITKLLTYQTEQLFTLYECDFTDAQGWKITNTSIYQALSTLTDAVIDCQWEFDQSVFPWRLKLKAWPVSSSMEMRMSRNVESMKVTVDRSAMFTRAYPTGKNDAHIDSVNGGVSYIDRNTATWGVVAQVITDSSIKDKNLLKAWAEKMLKKNAEPTVTVSISGMELSGITGEPMDRLTVGRICRVPLPKYGTVMTERLVDLSWKDVFGQPETVTVTLANEHRTIQSVLYERARGGGGGGKKSNDEKDQELKDDEAKIQEIDDSEIWINRDSIWNVCGSYTVTTDSSGKHITLNEGALLEVRRSGITSTVCDGGNVKSQINQSAEEVTISASKINLSGYVTASELSAVSAEITKLKTGVASASVLKSGQVQVSGWLSCGSFTFNGNAVTKRNITVDGTTYHVLSTSS